MSLAPSKSPRSAEPSFDLDYSIHDFEADQHRDSRYLYRRIEDVMACEGSASGGRTLDVACGVGRLAARVREHGAESWGLDPSPEMLGISRWLYPADRMVLVRGIAEALPFRDGSFHRVVCQGSLDHFVHPQVFMREAARILKPQGRVVIALSNYESLSCRLGSLLHGLARWLQRRPSTKDRPYWQPPPDHYHKGELSFVRRLGGGTLELERCYGVSLLWLLTGWGPLLGALPRSVARGVLVALDRVAHQAPVLADMIVSVWRPRRT